jgi:hypothetical protein
MKRNVLAVVALALLVGALLAVALSPATAQATTIKNRTLTTYRVPAGAHNIVYDHVTFKGGNSSTAVLTINRAAHNLTFTHCTIERGPYNGITINATNGNIHDITFTNCRVKAAGRMGIEVTQRPASSSTGPKRIRVVNTVFEPSGEEAMSYDGGYFASYDLISGVTVMGSDNKQNPAWSGAIEINGPTYFTVQNTKIFASRKNALNLEGPAGKNGHLVFRNLTINYSKRYESFPTDSSTARLTELQSVNGAVFTGCKFIVGKAYNAGWWTNSSNNNLSKSTVSGSVPAGRSLWSPDSSSRNNKMPVRR